MPEKTDVVLFDFDGTLSAGDSNIEFGKYCLRHSLRPWAYLPLIIFGALAKFFNPGGTWWREMMRRFLTQRMVSKFAPDFIKLHKMSRFGWAAEQVAAERANGRKVLLISAGPDYLITHLAKDMKFDAVITSKMNPAAPWEFESFCWGKKKVSAFNEWARQNKIIPRVVRSYSDNKSDLPMMEIAKEQVWINPKTGCRKTGY